MACRQRKKEIWSGYINIRQNRLQNEEDFKATFSQTILVDSKSIGKKNDEKGTMELEAYVIDYVGSPKIDGEKVEITEDTVQKAEE